MSDSSTIKMSDSLTDSVAAHYDRRAHESGADRRRCRVLPLRNANNGAKARLIENAVRRAAERIRATTASEPGNARERSIYVLDLGCGKGGDLLKYAHASETVGCTIVYCGVDLSSESVAQARRRADQTLTRHHFPGLLEIDFYVGDFCAVDNSDDALLRNKWRTADIVSMQFAMHYAFSAASTVRRLFDNIARTLAHDGELIGTLVDSTVLQMHAQTQKASSFVSSDGTLTIGNSLYNIRFAPETGQFLGLATNAAASSVLTPPSVFGLCYQFALDGCIDDCDEFVVDRDTLCKTAAVIALDLKIWMPIRCLYSSRDAASVDADPEQRQVSELYSAFVFARPFHKKN